MLGVLAEARAEKTEPRRPERGKVECEKGNENVRFEANIEIIFSRCTIASLKFNVT